MPVTLDLMEYANDAAAQAAYVSGKSAQTGLKYWSKLEAAGDITSPQLGPAGTVDGAPTYVACKFNNGLYSNANGEGYHFTNTGMILSGNKSTLEFWFKPDFDMVNGVPSDAGRHCFWSLNRAGSPRIEGYIHPTVGIVFIRTDDAVSDVSTLDTTTDWTAGDLVHIAFIWDKDAGFDGAKTMAIYVNGVETTSTTSALGTYTDDATVVAYVAMAQDGLYPIDGIMDNLKMYSITKIDFTDRNIETGYALECYSEDTIKEEGSYSLKGIGEMTSSLNETLTRTVDPTIDLSGQPRIYLYIRASRTGSHIKIGFHDSGGVTTEVTPNIASANVWQAVEVDISAVADADKDAIDSIIITIVNSDADNIFYLDDMYGGLIIVSRERNIVYDSVLCVSKTRNIVYDSVLFVSKTRDILYDSVLELSRERNIVYDSVLEVSRTRNIVYDLILELSRERDIVYDLILELSKERNIRYDLVLEVSKERNIVYDLFELIQKLKPPTGVWKKCERPTGVWVKQERPTGTWKKQDKPS